MRRATAVAVVLVVACAIVWLFADGEWDLGATISSERGPAFVPWPDGDPDLRTAWRGKWMWRPRARPPVTLSFLEDGTALLWFDPNLAPLECTWVESAVDGSVRIRISRGEASVAFESGALADRRAWRLLTPLAEP